VNPAHLFLGNPLINARDKMAKGRWNGPPFKTHCKHGHKFTVKNTYNRTDRPGRQCKACYTAERMARNARLKASA
jgi:hypothetical protein